MRVAMRAVVVVALLAATAMNVAFADRPSLARVATRDVVDDLVWLRHRDYPSSRVFMFTRARELLHSADGGKTFTSLTSELRGSSTLPAAPQIIHGPTDESGTLPGTADVVLQDWYGGRYWASKDLGDTWTQPCGESGAGDGGACFANPATRVPGGKGRAFTPVKPHPTRSGWLMSFVKTCDYDYMRDEPDPKCDVLRLLVSKDMGATWVDLIEQSKGKLASFLDFDWAPDDGTASTPPIYAVAHLDVKAFQTYRIGSWDYNVGLVHSTDLFATHRLVEQCANAFEILNTFAPNGGDVYTLMPPDCEAYHRKPKGRPSEVDSDDITLRISVDAGKTFNTVCFPSTLKKNGFVIYDFHADAGPDFIAVNHIDAFDERFRSAPAVQLYTSDPSLTFFSMSMRAMLRSEAVTAIQDFTNVLGLEGIYIANQINYKAFIDGPAMRTDYSSFFETRITFNAGGTWHRIPAPATDAEGRKYSCSSAEYDCSRYGLQLHGSVDWSTSEDWEGRLGGVYSRSIAPGIIISTGSVGDAVLHDDVSQINTYISRDGGKSWIETKKGVYIYEFGGNGGLLVIAKQFEEVDEIEYSINEGQSWTAIKLAAKVFVHNIRVDPTSAGHMFIVHGVSAQSSAADPNRGSYFIVDFDNILSQNKPCQASDYETWQPEAPGSHGCLMGQKFKIQRKKPSAECFDDSAFVRQHQVVGTCDCSRVFDTECDYGSERVYDVPNATEWPHCKTMSDINTQCSALRERHTTASNLRIVSGSKCSNPAAALGDDGRKHHRRHHPRGFAGAFFRFVFILGAVAAAVFGAIHVHQNYDLGTLSTTIPNAARNAVNGAYEKFQEKFGRREHPTPPGYFEPLGDFAAEDDI